MINKELLTKSIVSSFLGSFVNNINSINSIDVAKKRNIRVSTVIRDEPSEYNSLVRLIITTEKRTRSVAGSIFGGEPRIVEIKGIKINADLGNFNIYLTNKDKVGVISNVTNVLTKNKINIATFNLGRIREEGDAIAILQTDQLCNDKILNELRKIKYIDQVKSIAL